MCYREIVCALLLLQQEHTHYPLIVYNIFSLKDIWPLGSGKASDRIDIISRNYEKWFVAKKKYTGCIFMRGLSTTGP